MIRVVLQVVGPLHRQAQVVRLLGGQLRQLDGQGLQVGPHHLLVKLLGGEFIFTDLRIVQWPVAMSLPKILKSLTNSKYKCHFVGGVPSSELSSLAMSLILLADRKIGL